MKKLLSLILVFSIAINGFSQNFKYLSEKEMVDNNNTKNIEGKLVQLEIKQVPSWTGYKFWLTHLDNDLKTLDKVKVEIEDGVSIFSSSLITFNKKLYLLYWGRTRKTDIFFARTRKIDPVTLAIEEPIDIMETDQKPSNASLVDFEFKYNNDSTLLIFSLASKSSSLKTKKYSLQVLDNNLKSVYKRNVELFIKNENVLPQNITYSETEKVMYISYKNYEGPVDSYYETQYTKKIPEYTYNLLRVTENNEKPISINVQNNIIHKMNLQVEADNKIFVSGLLKKTCMANIHALFYGYLNTSTNKIDELKIINYSDEIINSIEEDGFKAVKKESPGLSPFFKPVYTFKRDNGSIDILCEYTNIVENTNGSSYFDEFTYGDLVNTNISTNGKAIFTRVPKSQYNVNHTNYLGTFAIKHKNKLIILYNDTKANLVNDIKDKPSTVERFGFKSSILMQVTIDENGIATRKKVDEANQNNFIALPKTIKKINDNLFSVKSTNENFFLYKFKFALLEIK